MAETEITILIFRKSDVDPIINEIQKRTIDAPIFIIEYENHYEIKLSSDYEQWELDSAIEGCFPEYEFTTNLQGGREEIRIQVERHQSEYSTEGWQIESPLNEVKYLVKATSRTPEKFNPKIKVLFGNDMQDYKVNIINGINKASGEKGFLLINYFKEESEEIATAEILKDKLYKSPLDAFYYGFLKLQDVANKDFQDYQELQKKKINEEQKIPRKVVREFINACNRCDFDGIIKNLAENIVYEKRIEWKTKQRVEGINEFIEFLKSTDQDLCSQSFKIGSHWSFHYSYITINIKYYPVSTNGDVDGFLKRKRFEFLLKDYKIENIIEDN